METATDPLINWTIPYTEGGKASGLISQMALGGGTYGDSVGGDDDTGVKALFIEDPAERVCSDKSKTFVSWFFERL